MRPESLNRAGLFARCLAGAVLSASVLLVTACGGQTGPSRGPEVASVPRSPGAGGPAGASSGAPGAGPEDARPLIREDTSDTEIIRMVSTYAACMRDHGVPVHGSGTGQLKTMDDGSSRYAPARSACASKAPENYQDRLARQHPAVFQDLLRKAISCAKAKGWTAARPDPRDPTQVDLLAASSLSVAERMSIWETCRKDAFAPRG